MGKGDWGPSSSPHATPPQGLRAPGLGPPGPLGPAIPPKLPHPRKEGLRKGKKATWTTFYLEKLRWKEAGKLPPTPPFLT